MIIAVNFPVCLNWKIYCDDHSLLSSTTAVQIWIISYTSHQKQRCRRNATCFVCHFKFKPSKKRFLTMLDDISVWLVTPILEPALYKLCTNINQLYLIWAAVLCHRPPPRDQRMLGEDTGSKDTALHSPKKRPRRGCMVQLMTWELILKMKSARPIIFQIKLIYNR